MDLRHVGWITNRAFSMCTATALALYGCQAVTDADRLAPLADVQASTVGAFTVTITDLGTLGGLASEGFSINDGGQVLGRSQTASGEFHAFLWEDGTMSDLGAFYPRDLNNAGQVAGFANSHAVLWKEGQLTDLGTLGGAWSYPAGCSFVFGPIDCGGFSSAPFRPFYTWARAINDSGHIIGVSATASGEQHGFVWHMGVMTDLGTLGGAWSEARAINARGQVVGMSQTVSGGAHGFLWENGTMTDLGTFQPQDINARGQIAGQDLFEFVGEFGETFQARHAAVWHDGTVTDLGAVQSNYQWSGAQAINDRGQVMGWTNDINIQAAFIWDAGVMTRLPNAPRGADDYFPNAMSQRSHVVAWGDVPTCVANNCYQDEHAVLWRDGVAIDLGTLPNPTPPEANGLCLKCSSPQGINTRGDVVGTAYSSDPAYFNQAHAVLWTIRPK